MTCNEVNAYLDRWDFHDAPSAVLDHLNTCEACRRLVEAFQTAPATHFSATKRTQIPLQVLENLKPVHPLPPWPFLLVACLAAAGVACSYGIVSWGTTGWHLQILPERILLFSSIAIALLALAYGLTTQMIPGTSRKISVNLFTIIALAVFALTVLTFFPRTDPRAASVYGACIERGVLIGALTAVFTYLTIRRGALLDRPTSYLLLGAFTAWAALLVQTVYCPMLTASHVFISHLSTGAVWFLCSWLFSRFSR